MRTATAGLILGLFILLLPNPARATDESGGERGQDGTFFQLSLFPPLQLVDSELPVEGIRLGVVPINQAMAGFDVGLVTWTSENLAALQFGLVNIVGDNADGVQFGSVNIVGRRGVGWQSALLNIDAAGFVGFQQGGVNIVGSEHACVGLQLGAVNYAYRMTGVQLGLVNLTPHLAGLQLGIVNYAGNSPLPVLPVANAAF